MTLCPAAGGAAEAWAADARAHGAPKTTLSTRSSHLNGWYRYIGNRIYRAESEDVADYLWNCRSDWSAATRRAHWCTLRNFYKWAVATGRSASDPTIGLKAPQSVPGRPRPTPEWAWTEAWARADATERIWLDLAGRHGMRRAEIAVMRVDDILPDLESDSLRVHGKGRRERIIPLRKTTARALHDVKSAGGGGFLWPGQQAGHISPWWLGKRINRVLPDGWTIHTLRHRAASVWYAVDHDIVTVSKLLGHASITTTQVYVAPPIAAARRLVEAA